MERLVQQHDVRGTVETVLAMLFVAATKDKELGYLDVKTAFLYGTVPDD